MHRNIVLIVALVLLALTACQETTVRGSATFERSSVSFPYDDLSGARVGISASGPWTLSSDQAWLTASPSSGTGGTTTVTLSVDAGNLSGDAADATLTLFVNGAVQGTLPITVLLPDLAGPFGDAISLNAALDKTATSDFSVQNSGSANLTVSASSSDAWLSVTPQDATVGPGSVALFDVSASCGSAAESRTGTIALSTNDPDEASSSVSVTVTCQDPPASAFTIDIQYYGDTLPTAEQQQVFEDAAARWAELIIGDLQDMSFSKAANVCGAGEPEFSGTVDDLLVFANVEYMDGVGGVLAAAGPCYARSIDGLPFIGTMSFDSADWDAMDAAGTLRDVILHEMGHTLGIGTLWEYQQDLVDPTGSSCDPFDTSTDYRFNGVEANAHHEAAGGTDRIVVENNGQQGTACSHWHEDTYHNELMTGYIDADMRLSSITVGSLTDLGYTTSHALADPYEVPLGTALRSSSTRTPLNEVLRRPVGEVLGDPHDH